MKFSIITILTCWILQTTGFHELEFNDIDGNNISLDQFAGKKILLVNIATGSSKVDQLARLQQLQVQHGDSVVVIGFPSNSFGHETRTNAEIKSFCQSNYGVTFLLAEKNSVGGFEIQSVYDWLTNAALNHVWGDQLRGDFQKFLVNRDGELVGFFSSGVDPLSDEIISAINQ